MKTIKRAKKLKLSKEIVIRDLARAVGGSGETFDCGETQGQDCHSSGCYRVHR